jgi:hypothetical protein
VLTDVTLLLVTAAGEHWTARVTVCCQGERCLYAALDTFLRTVEDNESGSRRTVLEQRSSNL